MGVVVWCWVVGLIVRLGKSVGKFFSSPTPFFFFFVLVIFITVALFTGINDTFAAANAHGFFEVVT
jgi:hypothetical protein